jgi:uroporphyrinogen decarboxylase
VLLAPRDVVQTQAAAVLAQAAGRAGHIFNLGHGVLPDTPQEALRDLVQFVHSYRHQTAEVRA